MHAVRAQDLWCRGVEAIRRVGGYRCRTWGCSKARAGQEPGRGRGGHWGLRQFVGLGM